MAGTNKIVEGLPDSHPKGPAIILVNPQLPENIGTTARAMLNCGLMDLRLVKPREKWPNDDAIPASSGASIVLNNAKLYATTKEAIQDLNFVFATTARHRDMIKSSYTPDLAAKEIIARHNNTKTECGVLFGPERSGLTNDDVSLADAILHVPLNSGFSSLNLAQAVLLIGYSWFSQCEEQQSQDLTLHMGDTKPATKDQLDLMLERLTTALDEKGFFNSPSRKPSTIRSLRNMFGRMEFTEQEIQTMHGIITALAYAKHPKNK